MIDVKENVDETFEKLPRLVTPNELAKTGILPIYSIRKGIKNGTIPCVKIGNNYRINYDKFIKMLNDM